MLSNHLPRLLGALSLSLVAAAASAENPGSGTLTIHEQVIEYSEGPNIGYNVTPLVAGQAGDPGLLTCNEVLPCDHFALTIDLPEDIGAVFPSATVRMVFSWDDMTGAGVEDYDIYVYDKDGNRTGESDSFDMPEVVVELARGGVTERFIDIMYFSNVASTYTAKLELVLGEPAAGADLDAFFGSGDEEEGEEGGAADGLVSGLKSADQQAAGASGAAGGLGLATLLLAASGLRRRRRLA